MVPADLVLAAQAARERAYAPYSHFRVGAALRLADGRIASACNVENASYGLSCCAERAAVFRAVAEGGGAPIREILVSTDAQRPVAPCGACRQVLAEFAPPAAVVWMVGRSGAHLRRTLGELLPEAFRRADIGG